MSDFMCTNTVQALIRNDKLVYVINQRSCDAIFGFKNDAFWHIHVQGELVKELKVDYPELERGEIQYQFGSLHVYERHFKFIKT
jgi:thymidylate synthase